jgi:CubicO group peptidase (beta-lactamase class C family)
VPVARAWPGPPATPRTAGAPGLEERVDAYLRPLVDADLLSGTVLIARDGEVLLARGYGLANREFGIANGPETKFRIGSITKQFTAMAVLLLARRGRLRLDDTVDRFIPDYPAGDRITIHHLLTHTSGIPSYNHLPDYAEKMMQPLTPQEVTAWVREKPLQFEPGTAQKYSNSGYVLLTVIIEQASGMAYEDCLRTLIFDPLGMDDTGVDNSMKILANRATGHVNPGGTVYQTFYRDMPLVSGDGALYSTAPDLYRWDRALRECELLPQRWMEKVLEPQEGDYAYGWFVERRFGHRLLSHRGTMSGFFTDIQRFVDDGVLVVALFNYESSLARDVFRDLGAIALGEPQTPLIAAVAPAVDPALLRACAGTYCIEPGFELTFTVEKNRLWMEGPNMGKVAAAPLSAGRFLFRETNALASFTTPEGKTVPELTLVNGARRFTCPRKE